MKKSGENDKAEEQNSLIEENALKAAEGEAAALALMLRGILDGPLYVPNRRQSSELTFKPKYPNELVSIMGVDDRERVVTPVFSRPAFIVEWCGQQLAYSRHTFQSLASVLPAGWWLTINPGQDIEKEISPWEIEKLREGERAIPEVIDELSRETSIDQSIEIRSPDGRYKELQSALSDAARANPKIISLYLAVESSQTIEQKERETLLVGIECSALNQNELEAIKIDFEKISDLHLVGDNESKIFAGKRGSSIILGVFKGILPFYTAASEGAGIGLFFKRLRSNKTQEK